jgi:DNA-binding transcriptional ArsR family regulator
VLGIVQRAPPVMSAPAATPLAEPSVPAGALLAAASLGAVAAASAGPALAPRLGFLRRLFWLPLAGLFTRLKGSELLEHPVRNQILQLVEAQPGIHYQALVRTVEKGNGVLEHHLRMLTQGGLLRERAANGYTCYFPMGMDRRLMDVHAVLKSDVAREMLDRMVRHPGLGASDLARELGVTPKAVTYHLNRFASAGLISLQREGRTVRAFTNAIALEATAPMMVATAA